MPPSDLQDRAEQEVQADTQPPTGRQQEQQAATGRQEGVRQEKQAGGATGVPGVRASCRQAVASVGALAAGTRLGTTVALVPWNSLESVLWCTTAMLLSLGYVLIN